jgi:hypothetical protein
MLATEQVAGGERLYRKDIMQMYGMTSSQVGGWLLNIHLPKHLDAKGLRWTTRVDIEALRAELELGRTASSSHVHESKVGERAAEAKEVEAWWDFEGREKFKMGELTGREIVAKCQAIHKNPEKMGAYAYEVLPSDLYEILVEKTRIDRAPKDCGPMVTLAGGPWDRGMARYGQYRLYDNERRELPASMRA